MIAYCDRIQRVKESPRLRRAASCFRTVGHIDYPRRVIDALNAASASAGFPPSGGVLEYLRAQLLYTGGKLQEKMGATVEGLYRNPYSPFALEVGRDIPKAHLGASGQPLHCLMSVIEKSASSMTAPVRSAFRRVALCSFAPVKFAPRRSAPVSTAPDRSAR